MRLTRVVRDETCERHTLHCLGCEEVERPLVPLAPRHGASAKDNQTDQKFAPSSAWARAVAVATTRHADKISVFMVPKTYQVSRRT